MCVFSVTLGVSVLSVIGFTLAVFFYLFFFLLHSSMLWCVCVCCCGGRSSENVRLTWNYTSFLNLLCVIVGVGFWIVVVKTNLRF